MLRKALRLNVEGLFYKNDMSLLERIKEDVQDIVTDAVGWGSPITLTAPDDTLIVATAFFNFLEREHFSCFI